MGKIIRLMESNLINIIKKIVLESKRNYDKKNFSESFVEKMIDSDSEEDTESENEGVPIDPEESSSPVSFLDMTIKVIKNLEGGYYNPNWHYESEMGGSGETMFGLDRKTGGDTVVNSPAGKQFWGIIDKNKTKNIWKRYYRGGNLENELTTLAAKVMEPVFYRNMNSNFNEEQKKIIMNYKPLLFNFIYASWNGQGWFARFADTFKKELAKGVTSPDKLDQAVIDHRKSSKSGVIKKGGYQIEKMKSQLL